MKGHKTILLAAEQHARPRNNNPDKGSGKQGDRERTPQYLAECKVKPENIAAVMPKNAGSKLRKKLG